MTEPPVVDAIDRALQLLLALAAAGPSGATLGQLAASTGANKSTLHRALGTLRARGFATQSAGGEYQLGPAAMSLGERFLTPERLAESLHPALVALSRETNELVHLGIWTDDHVVYIDKVEPQRAIRVWSAVGQRVPVATSSLGRAMLAARDVDDEQLAVYVRRLPAERPLTAERLAAVVRQARRRGYATELEENEPGVACIGTALVRGGQVVAALSITSQAERMTSGRQKELVEAIRREVPPLLPDGIELMAQRG